MAVSEPEKMAESTSIKSSMAISSQTLPKRGPISETASKSNENETGKKITL
jgi:hypothetical protein